MPIYPRDVLVAGGDKCVAAEIITWRNNCKLCLFVCVFRLFILAQGLLYSCNILYTFTKKGI